MSYRELPRPYFGQLQAALFPIYFGMQTVLPVVLALTFPASSPASSLSSSYLASTSLPLSKSSFAGVLQQQNLWTALVPFGTMFVSGLLNAVWIGPVTTRVMRERRTQEGRDGKKSYDKGPHSAEMQALNKRFGRLHGVGTLLNLVGIGAMVGYGWVLGGRIC